MNIPVSGNTTNGIVKFTITAIDDSSPANSTMNSFTVNCDNMAPSQADLTNGRGGNVINNTNKIVQSNGSFALSSTVTENGSGFGRVAFYLMRDVDSDSEDRLYNPMETRVGNANRTYKNELTLIDGLYAKELSGSNTRESTDTFKHDEIKTNMNIRQGGVVQIGRAHV